MNKLSRLEEEIINFFSQRNYKVVVSLHEDKGDLSLRTEFTDIGLVTSFCLRKEQNDTAFCTAVELKADSKIGRLVKGITMDDTSLSDSIEEFWIEKSKDIIVTKKDIEEYLKFKGNRS